MEVFLPIAQVFVNPIEILFLSAIVGVLSGLFGVGGGFLMTPFLIFLGVPPAYAVANEANNILATSVSGSTTHYLKINLHHKAKSHYQTKTCSQDRYSQCSFHQVLIYLFG